MGNVLTPEDIMEPKCGDVFKIAGVGPLPVIEKKKKKKESFGS